MKSPKLLLVGGPQASGKTTFVESFLEQHPRFTLISSDLFWPRHEDTNKRYWIDEEGTPHDWGTVVISPEILQRAWRWTYGQFLKALMARKDIVFESTFISRKDRKGILQDAHDEEYYIEGVFFFPSLLVCAQRNENRHDRVPDRVLARTYAQIDPPHLSEGFKRLQIM